MAYNSAEVIQIADYRQRRAKNKVPDGEKVVLPAMSIHELRCLIEYLPRWQAAMGKGNSDIEPLEWNERNILFDCICERLQSLFDSKN